MDERERLARGLLFVLYPDWMRRWGWTEATAEMKMECLDKATIVLEEMRRYK